MISTTPERPVITILTPVFNEEDNLLNYKKAIQNILLTKKNYDFRILFIEDGSTDNSWKIIQDICSQDDHFSGIRLSRNFGSHVALSAGFANSDGNAVATLACDLQDPPEIILEFLQKWQEGAKIVWGKRKSRDEESWRIYVSSIFSKLIAKFAMPPDSKFTTGSFFLIDKKVANCFREFQERNRITFALVAWTGFDQSVVLYDRKKRLAGKSGWNFNKMIKSMYDAFIGFSFLPVRIMTVLGVAIFVLSFALGVYLLFLKITGNPLPGWTGIMLSFTFFFGLQFLLMGITGEYLYRIYSEVVRRPLYFISDMTSEKK